MANADEGIRLLTEIRDELKLIRYVLGDGNNAHAQPAQPVSQALCARHQVPMEYHEKDGEGWYSHKVDGKWCRGN